MTIAPERPVTPFEPPAALEVTPNLLDLAETVHRNMPGFRPEIIGGALTVSPPADGQHARSLTGLTLALAALHGKETLVVQGVGLWLPTGTFDHVVPDLAVVDGDFEDHQMPYNCYAPSAFRLVVEITSTNRANDVMMKPRVYAQAEVPVYLIGDRQNREAVLLTDPLEGEYRSRSVYRPGESFTLPESIGAAVELDVDTLLGRA
ncbi:Uma2 family endonuclease [Streptomyces sp. 8K308]|uniref:Uma2 family endonuclease n=1 Tax=Streptomyces sp. 8K308 TaxID=2530388 RepID=UPI0010466159|nr:Uma2 family endonuclease [Streptomyces sp. 8K308]TDC26954.1 Uma2 family endonuclease [Streptomyces sp. 8K308]